MRTYIKKWMSFLLEVPYTFVPNPELTFTLIEIIFIRLTLLDGKAGGTLSSRHVSSCDVNAYSWDVRGDFTLNSSCGADTHFCHSAYVT